MLGRFLPALTVAATLLASSPGAHAEPETQEATELARQRFAQGAEAYSQQRFKDAIDLFLEADRVAPNPAFAYNIGLAYEELGDADNALLWYRNYLRALPNAPDRVEIEPRIAAAERRLRDRGVQQVTVMSEPSTATLSVDGERLGITPWTGQLKPGRHRLDLELRGYADATQTLELPSDHAIDVTVKMKTPAPAAPVVAPPAEASPTQAPEAATEPSHPGRVRPITWGALGVGVAGLGTAVAFELARSSAVSDARQASTNLEGKDLYDRAKSDETLARVSLALGSAFAVAGGVLLYLDLSSGDHGAPGTQAAIGCSGPTCGVRVHGRF